MIFLWHTYPWGKSWFPKSNGAALAVCFFFLISGFCTGYSGYQKAEKPTPKNIFSYVFKKILKFYPLLFLTTFGMFIMCEKNISNIKQLFKNLFLIQSWFKSGYFAFNGVTWFLSSLMFLYIFKIPLLYLLNKLNEQKKGKIWICLLLTLTSISMVSYYYLTRNQDIQYYQYIFPLARFFEYFIGMMIGFLIKSLIPLIKDTKTNSIIFTFLEIFALLFWISSAYSTIKYNWAVFTLHFVFPNIVLLSIFAFGKGYISKLFSCKFFVSLGNISNETYLIHQPFLLVVFPHFYLNSCFGNLIVSFVSVILISYIYRFVEKAVRNELKNTIKSWKNKKTTTDKEIANSNIEPETLANEQ